MPKIILGFFAALSFISISSWASTPVSFTEKELSSFYTLMKPEHMNVQINGKKGIFSPGPALEFVGVDPLEFEMDLVITNLVGLRFNQVRSEGIAVGFKNGMLRVEISVADQLKAIRSDLGSIDIRGTKLVGWVSLSSENGVRAKLDHGEILGEFKGSGVLKPRWVIDSIKKIVVKVLSQQLERVLARAEVQTSVEKGFVTWAQFSEDRKLSRVAPGSVKITDSGISFEAD